MFTVGYWYYYGISTLGYVGIRTWIKVTKSFCCKKQSCYIYIYIYTFCTSVIRLASGVGAVGNSWQEVYFVYFLKEKKGQISGITKPKTHADVNGERKS